MGGCERPNEGGRSFSWKLPASCAPSNGRFRSHSKFCFRSYDHSPSPLGFCRVISVFIKSPSSIIQLHSCLNGAEGQQQARGLLSRAAESRTRGADPQSGLQRITVKQTDEYGNNRACWRDVTPAELERGGLCFVTAKDGPGLLALPSLGRNSNAFETRWNIPLQAAEGNCKLIKLT